MMRRMIAVIAVVFLVMGVGLILFHQAILTAIGKFLIVEESLEPSDVIHVIAGHDEQTDYAIGLYRRGYAKTIFFTGGWCAELGAYHGQRGRERALRLGVPSEAIFIDDAPVTSTYGEVTKLKEHINRSGGGIRSVIAVSDPYHMRRARWTYRQVLGDELMLRMAPVPFELSQHKQRWWTDTGTRVMVREEYVKTAYYYARYRYSWGSVRDWLASFDRN